MKNYKRAGKNSTTFQGLLFDIYSSPWYHVKTDVRTWGGKLCDLIWLPFPFYTNKNRIKDFIDARLIITRNDEDI